MKVAASEIIRAQTVVHAQRGYGLRLESDEEEKGLERPVRESENLVSEFEADEQDPE